MDDIFFDKSEKGREELVTRKYQLPSKLRPLLVIIDGKHCSSLLLKKVAGLGLTEDSLATLLEQGFVVQKDILPTIIPVDKSLSHVPKKRLLCTPKPERIVAIRQFFNESIKSKLGLRGFALQLKVERAVSIFDFLELGEVLIDSIQKSKGVDVACLIRSELDVLLYDFID